jgi:hypothetical protein
MLVIRAEDEFERLLAAAQSQMRSPQVKNRRSAGNNLRVAVERLAKLIIIADRKGRGQAASLSDLKNKNLRELRPLVAPCSLSPDEPGLWDVCQGPQ